jgi:hypothetical protein
MMASNCVYKFFLLLFLIVSYASLTLAAVDQTKKPQDAISERVWPTYGTPMAASIDISREHTKGILPDINGETRRAPLRGDAPLDGLMDFSQKYFRDNSTFTVFNGAETRWSLAPLSEKFNLNPMTDIRNLEVLLQLKF